jgi:hypothetical protein
MSSANAYAASRDVFGQRRANMIDFLALNSRQSNRISIGNWMDRCDGGWKIYERRSTENGDQRPRGFGPTKVKLKDMSDDEPMSDVKGPYLQSRYSIY